ncbi:C40 family peptidase [Geodermatophilus sp. YIM 151500]|uniref:C40 family peptidase n=1 Tax=Geodermatophilus sp. YIM 151500 TaxID=2984531 RepID=UPI0021E4B67E|nr:C40 family peptidase [Geodermatophilus sp. YIM 151500]MCV2490137.1 C40 family peptidase [Geodermatophilus sp. YIM 151500]
MQHTRTTPRRRTARAATAVGAVLVALATGVLAPAPASAEPATVAEAGAQVEQAALQLTQIDEQVHEAEVTVAAQQAAAATAAQHAAEAQAALAALEPRLAAIAQSGYTGRTQSRMAAFLTSESATELVQQMTTLDMIADHTEAVVAEVAAAQRAAAEAQAAADQAAATARAGLEELQAQKAQLQTRVAEYQAIFARLTAAEQARVTERLAGPALEAPATAELPPAPSGAAGAAVRAALAQIGAPYEWGSSGPRGFDCSGLTRFAFAAAGVELPHSSRAQAGMGTRVSRDQLQPGDLVFFYSPISHVGLYIGNGKMVHARTFGRPVAVTSVDQRGYAGAVRISAPAG